MHRLGLLVITGCLLSISASAQQLDSGRWPHAVPKSLPKPVVPPEPLPVCLLNAQVIVSFNELRSIGQPRIRKFKLLSEKHAPRQWRRLAVNGILLVRLKDKFTPESKSLADIRQELAISGPARFELDGVPLDDTTLRVASVAIAALEVKPPSGGRAETVVGIRIRRPLPLPAVLPDTIIRIRGTARR